MEQMPTINLVVPSPPTGLENLVLVFLMKLLQMLLDVWYHNH
jgi:hypothetical protein